MALRPDDEAWLNEDTTPAPAAAPALSPEDAAWLDDAPPVAAAPAQPAPPAEPALSAEDAAWLDEPAGGVSGNFGTAPVGPNVTGNFGPTNGAGQFGPASTDSPVVTEAKRMFGPSREDINATMQAKFAKLPRGAHVIPAYQKYYSNSLKDTVAEQGFGGLLETMAEGLQEDLIRVVGIVPAMGEVAGEVAGAAVQDWNDILGDPLGAPGRAVAQLGGGTAPASANDPTTGRYTYMLKPGEKMPESWKDRPDMGEGRAARALIGGAKGLHAGLVESATGTIESILPDPGGNWFGLQQLRDHPVEFLGNIAAVGGAATIGLRRAASSSTKRAAVAEAAGDAAQAAQWTERAVKLHKFADKSAAAVAKIEPLRLLWRASTGTGGAVGRVLSKRMYGDPDVLARKVRVFTKPVSELLNREITLSSGDVVHEGTLLESTKARSLSQRRDVAARAGEIPEDMVLPLEERLRGLDGDFVIKVDGKPPIEAPAAPAPTPAPARPVVDPAQAVPVGPVSAAKMQVAALDEGLANLDELRTNALRKQDAALDAGDVEAFNLATDELDALRRRSDDLTRQRTAADAHLQAQRQAPERKPAFKDVPRGTTKEQWKALYGEDYRVALRQEAARDAAARAAARSQVAAATTDVRSQFARLVDARKAQRVVEQVDLDGLLLTEEALKRVDASVAAVNANEVRLSRVRSRDTATTAAERRAALQEIPVDLLRGDEWARATEAVERYAAAEAAVASAKKAGVAADIAKAEAKLRTAAQEVGAQTRGVRERMVEARKAFAAQAEDMRAGAAAVWKRYQTPKSGADKLRAASRKAAQRKPKTPQEIARAQKVEAIAGHARLSEARRETLRRVAAEAKEATRDVKKASARLEAAQKVAKAAREDADLAAKAAEVAPPGEVGTAAKRAKSKARAAAEAEARVQEAQTVVSRAQQAEQARSLGQPVSEPPPPSKPPPFVPPIEGEAHYATLRDWSRAHGIDIEVAADGSRTVNKLDPEEWAALDAERGGYYSWLRDNVPVSKLAEGVEGFYVQKGPNGAAHVIEQIDPLSPTANAWKLESLQRGAEAVDLGLLSEEAFVAHAPDYVRDFYAQHLKGYDVPGAQPPTGAPRVAGMGQVQADYARKARYKDLSLSARQKMGLVRDTRFTLAKSQAELISDIELSKLFRDLKGATFKGGPNDGLPYAMPAKTDLHTYHLKSRTGGFARRKVKGFGALEDQWVTPEVGRLIEATRAVPGVVERFYMGTQNLFKMGKVPLNPASLLRDVVGTSWLAYQAGLDPLLSPAARSGLKGLWADTVNELKGKGSGWDWKRYEAVNGPAGGFVGAEVSFRQTLDDLARNDPFTDLGPTPNPMERGGAIGDALQKAWAKSGGRAVNGMLFAKQFTDSVYRRWGFRQAVTLLDEHLATGRITPEMRRVFGDDLDRVTKLKGLDRDMAALNHAHRVSFNYADIPVAVRWVKNAWLPFFTFQYKSIQQVARYMAERPVEAALMRASYDAANAMSYTMDGEPLSDEELYDAVAALHGRPAYRSKVGSFYEGTKAYENVNGGDPVEQHRFWDAQWYTIGSGWFQPPDTFGAQGERGALQKVVGSSQNPLLTWLSGAMTGTDPFSGQKIARSPSSSGSDFLGWSARLWGPTALVQGVPKVVSAATGTGDYKGRYRSVPEALADMFAGLRYDLVPKGLGIGEWAQKAARSVQDEVSAAKRDMRRFPVGSPARDERREQAMQYGRDVREMVDERRLDILRDQEAIRLRQGGQ